MTLPCPSFSTIGLNLPSTAIGSIPNFMQSRTDGAYCRESAGTGSTSELLIIFFSVTMAEIKMLRTYLSPTKLPTWYFIIAQFRSSDPPCLMQSLDHRLRRRYFALLPRDALSILLLLLLIITGSDSAHDFFCTILIKNFHEINISASAHALSHHDIYSTSIRKTQPSRLMKL